MSALETAKAKLLAVDFIDFEGLPKNVQDPGWTEIRDAHTSANLLTFKEMTALKNASCSSSANQGGGGRAGDYQGGAAALDLKAQVKAELTAELTDSFNVKMSLNFTSKDRPRRALSYVSKSEAWNSLCGSERINLGADFFFDLVEGPSTTTKAFESQAPEASMDENKVHHPYFLREAAKLVDDAKEITIRQQLFWSKSGHWLSLDDSPGSTGVEPDFVSTDRQGTESIANPENGSQSPASKYAVTVAFEQKKGFKDVDQMEAIDYGERLLCIQRGRRVAYTALFYCCLEEKWIRWIRVSASDEERFRVDVTRPTSLSPGGEGQRQLLTVLCMTSAALGLDFPQVKLSGSGTLDIHKLLGEGATSRVFFATYNERKGALKILQPGFVTFAPAEYTILQNLKSNNVPHVPTCTLVAPNALFFDRVLSSALQCSSGNLAQLVACLQETHKANVVHRDVRPENLMVDPEGNAVLNDWGCSNAAGTSVPFQGTFRYASAEVNAAALKKEDRIPKPQDDLHSLLRSVLALSNTQIRATLADLEQGDFAGATSFWTAWRGHHPVHEAFFEAAEKLEYATLKQLI